MIRDGKQGPSDGAFLLHVKEFLLNKAWKIVINRTNFASFIIYLLINLNE
jgi:hypothetical protein